MVAIVTLSVGLLCVAEVVAAEWICWRRHYADYPQKAVPSK
jgi:hypothetical protein